MMVLGGRVAPVTTGSGDERLSSHTGRIEICYDTDPVKFAEVDETITWTMTMPSGLNCYLSTTYAFGGINRFNA